MFPTDTIRLASFFDSEPGADATSFTRSHIGLPLNSSPASVDVDPVTVAVAQIVENRAVIEQAKGVLMAVYDIDADSAFDLLKWGSQHTNTKLRILQINS